MGGSGRPFSLAPARRPRVVYRAAVASVPGRQGWSEWGRSRMRNGSGSATSGRERQPAQGGAGGVPEAGAAPRARGALDPRTAVAGGRVLLAGPPFARRPPCPGARPPQRRAAGLGLERGRELQDAAGAVSRGALRQGPGHCCICGQPVFRFGWHRRSGRRRPPSRGQWHAPCVAAWKFWNAPSDQARL